MEEIRMEASLQEAFDTAVELFLQQLQQEEELKLENWGSRLNAAEIPEVLLQRLPDYPAHFSGKDQLLQIICVKLLLLARGLEADIRDREWQVMYRRCGLDGGSPCTMAEIAEHFGVSQDRIRMIDQRFIRQIRRCLFRRSRSIRDFYT